MIITFHAVKRHFLNYVIYLILFRDAKNYSPLEFLFRCLLLRMPTEVSRRATACLEQHFLTRRRVRCEKLKVMKRIIRPTENFFKPVVAPNANYFATKIEKSRQVLGRHFKQPDILGATSKNVNRQTKYGATRVQVQSQPCRSKIMIKLLHIFLPLNVT